MKVRIDPPIHTEKGATTRMSSAKPRTPSNSGVVFEMGRPRPMREVDGMYLYNLRIPSSLGGHDLVKGDELTIRVEPFGSAGGTLDVVVLIRK